MVKSIAERQHAVKSADQLGQRTAAGDAFSALVVQVLRLNGLLVAAGDALAKPAGQTSARWQVLAAVEETPAAVAQIARTLGLARQSVQRVADVLVAEGLAAYGDNPAHQRAKLVHLTAHGRAALQTIQAAQCGWADVLGAELGEAELRQASAILARVGQAVGRHPPDGAERPPDDTNGGAGLRNAPEADQHAA
jgi:DNA-binding MarR family transcriptional regulator